MGFVHQCVITILSFPLKMSWWPPAPAIFASRDCANVRVTWGLCVGGELAWCWRTLDRNGGLSWSFIANVQCGRAVLCRLQVTENRYEILLRSPRYQLTARASLYDSLWWPSQISKLEHGWISFITIVTTIVIFMYGFEEISPNVWMNILL